MFLGFKNYCVEIFENVPHSDTTTLLKLDYNLLFDCCHNWSLVLQIKFIACLFLNPIVKNYWLDIFSKLPFLENKVVFRKKKLFSKKCSDCARYSLCTTLRRSGKQND